MSNTPESDTELSHLYNPSIQDLELDENQGIDRAVVYLDQVEALIQTAIDTAVEQAKFDYRGEINQEFVSLMADNPNLDKQVVKSAIWIMNGRMAEKEAERLTPPPVEHKAEESIS